MTSEEQRALVFREQWAARIRYRYNQVRALAGSPSALHDLWDGVRPMYDPTNYIPDAGEMGEGGFYTPLDLDADGSASGAGISLPGVQNAGD
ncbi:MAG: hypothetical protein WAU42_14760 [Solirubrobacteraceae bacterium]